MNTNLIYSIAGLIGGLLCCVGDVLFDLKGAGNQKLGTSKNIDSNWLKMAEWRFGTSIMIAVIGDIGVGLGFYSIADQISGMHPVLSAVTGLTGYAGAVGGVLIHSSLCIQAVIYKRIMSGGEENFSIADHTLEGFYKAIMPPFVLLYLVLMTADICVVIAVLNGALAVPKWMALLNSVVFLLIGWLFRAIDPKKFQDLPGIIMPSLGLAMVGLTGIIAIL